MTKTASFSLVFVAISTFCMAAAAQPGGGAVPCQEPDCGNGDMAYDCFVDADCPAGFACSFDNICIERATWCYEDYDCRAGEVCAYRDSRARPEGDCACIEPDCSDCYMPPAEGICEVQQVTCGGEVCEAGFQCDAVTAPCPDLADCTGEPSYECVPTVAYCYNDDDCLPDWSCEVSESADNVRCAPLVDATEPDQGMPARRCGGASLCVPPGGSASCEGAVCSVFANLDVAPLSQRNDGCTVASSSTTSSPLSTIVLLAGLVSLVIRRR